MLKMITSNTRRLDRGINYAKIEKVLLKNPVLLYVLYALKSATICHLSRRAVGNKTAQQSISG